MYYGLFQDQLVVGGEWGWCCYFPRHNFNGTILNNINMPLLWVIIDTALTLLNRLIRKLSVQFLGSCISVNTALMSFTNVNNIGLLELLLNIMFINTSLK